MNTVDLSQTSILPLILGLIMTELAVLEKLERIEKLIAEGRMTDRWISLEEAVRYSGLSESTLRRAIRAGKLKASRATGKLMLRLSWIDKFLGG